MSYQIRCEDCGREREVTKRTYDEHLNYGSYKYCRSCVWNHRGKSGRPVICKCCGEKRLLKSTNSVGIEKIDGKIYKNCATCSQKNKMITEKALKQRAENAKRKWFVTCKCCGEDREVSQTTHRRYHKYQENQVCRNCMYGIRSRQKIATNDEQRLEALQNFSITEAEAELIHQYKKHKVWWKRMVKKRDGNKCTKCGSTNKLHSHHIIPVGHDRSKEFDIDNGTTLCEKCHEDEHNRLMYERAAK